MGERLAKSCARCGQTKPVESFHRQGSRGRHSYCADCYNASYRGEARKPVPADIRRAHNVKSRYGLTTADVERMREEQGGRCAICKGEMARQCIDHCHATGKVRGLLCHPCNVALPHVEDDAFRAAALAYLMERG